MGSLEKAVGIRKCQEHGIQPYTEIEVIKIDFTTLSKYIYGIEYGSTSMS